MSDPDARTAVLVIDMVGDMFGRAELAAQRAALTATINALTAAARSAGHRIVWVRQEFAEDLSDAPLEYRRRAIHSTIAGTAGAALLPELNAEPSDHVVIKKPYSGFFGTDLDDYLRRENVQRLLISGVNTHACVRTTAIDAYQRDYDVALVSDAIGSWDQEHHEVSLRYMDGKIGRVLPLAELLDGRL